MIVIDFEKRVHEQITEESWCQGPYGFEEGQPIGNCPVGGELPKYCSLCLYGWIDQRYPGETHREEGIRVEALLDGLAFVNDEGYECGYIGWNDSPSRKFDDVLALLRKLDI